MQFIREGVILKKKKLLKGGDQTIVDKLYINYYNFFFTLSPCLLVDEPFGDGQGRDEGIF